MAKVVWDVTMSIDGFIADPRDNPGVIFDWYFKGDTLSAFSTETLKFKLSREDAEYFDEAARTLGAMVAGRRTYDVSQGWQGSFFLPVPFFVLTHRPQITVPKGVTKFTFVTDGIESAIEQAKVAAGGKTVGLMGANIAKQCIEAGLLDELNVHISPFLLGDGVRLYYHEGANIVEFKTTKIIESSSGVTHIRYRVVK
jgi:dihydrofolate reductase